MRAKKILLIIGIASLIAIAGCAENAGDSSEQEAEDLAEGAGQDVSNVKFGGSYMYEAKLTEKNQLGLVKAQPPFTMETSLERANLIERYKYLNDKSNVHHVYAMSNDGKVISYWVAQGKVSSVNSKLTNDRQPVRIPDCDHHNSGNDCWKMVESPQMDGSYGTNGNAIFFFTTSGKYVEWNGKYVVSEEPMNIQTTVSLEQQTNTNSTNANGA